VTGFWWYKSVPNHWLRTRVKHVCRFVGGGTPDKGNIEFWNGQIPWVSPKDMKSSEIFDTEDHITEEGLEASAAKIVSPGAVLIVMRSGILQHSIPVAINRVPVTLNQDMRALIPIPTLEARYLARLIEGHQREFLNIWSKEGTTVESLESDLVTDTEIALPPVPQQRAIAEYLDRETARLDGLVAAKERVLGLLAEKRRALITRAVTRGLNPRASLRDSGIPWLGEIPAHWQAKRAKWLFRERDDRSTTGEEVLLSLRMERGLVPHNEVSEKQTRADELIGYKKASLNEIVLNRMRAASGLVAVSPQDGLVSPDYAVFIAAPGVDPYYFANLFKTVLLQAVFRSESTGLGTGSSGFLRLYSESFLALWLPCPPFQEQRAINEYLLKEMGRLDALRTATERTIALLKERRAALISAAVTGQIDVNGAVARL
jgi:type I restriction enzyme S subunit